MFLLVIYYVAQRSTAHRQSTIYRVLPNLQRIKSQIFVPIDTIFCHINFHLVRVSIRYQVIVLFTIFFPFKFNRFNDIMGI